VNEDELKERARQVFKDLKKAFPNPRVELDYSNPLELLVATILAAQCTDVKVNQVTQQLFAKYRSPRDYLKVPVEELEEDIHPTGFFRQKARNIRCSMEVLLENHGGEVPPCMEDLVRLPGVGRKTANVILGNIYDIPGIVVDTHMGRVSRRLGLTRAEDPVAIERALGKLLPPKDWTLFSQIMVLQGRYICKARKPQCDECAVMARCEYFENTPAAKRGL
jgi:endonuclease-3